MANTQDVSHSTGSPASVNMEYDPKSVRNEPSSFTNRIFHRNIIRRRTEIILAGLFAIMLAIAAFCVATFATKAHQPSSSGATVAASYGRYQGVELRDGVTQFLGVRYAATPERFSAPQPPRAFQGVHIADSYAPVCRGAGKAAGGDSEDCLFADIFAPTGANSSSKHPVYVFIQGGGLSNALAHINGTSLIKAANHNLVTVGFSYRTGPFGFLASKEVQDGASLNVGYLDQHQLLTWVKKEIAEFGGDPDRITLGGQSAGAGSVVSQLVAYGGVDKGLFHAALMESSSMTAIHNVSDQQFQYDAIVKNIGCEDDADTLACLRSKSMDEILAASKSMPSPGTVGRPVFYWKPVVDGDFMRDVPIAAFKKGNFIKVPTIFGDDTNEGTIFTSHDIVSEQGARNFIKNNFPAISTDQLDNFSSMYGFNETTLVGDKYYWQKAATAFGEVRYICPGMRLSNIIQAQPELKDKVWNWRFNFATPKQISSGSGASHGSELTAVFGPSQGGAPQAVRILSSEEGMKNVVKPLQSYWISFIQTLDPNTRKDTSAPEWTSWKGDNRVLFNLNGTTMETVDQEQLERCGYLAQIDIQLKQ